MGANLAGKILSLSSDIVSSTLIKGIKLDAHPTFLTYLKFFPYLGNRLK